MLLGALLCLAAASAALSAESPDRTVHRLIGGHLKIYQDDADTESLLASASGSKDKTKKPEEEERKTLSQQVADGKYGLIQKELFTKPAKRPGVVSYEANPEVPTDNINSLGGLTKNEIWLAENHLLVLRGGSFHPEEDKKEGLSQIWPSIDDYKAPPRQVKIPKHPKVPPPFPVQLTDEGPLQIIGTNSSRTINGTFDASLYSLPPEQGYEPGTGPFFYAPYATGPDSTNPASGQAPESVPGATPGDFQQGAPPPFPPYQLNGTLPPFFASLPPGAVILPPPSNQTDPLDEDDPSIYYPPPYSFFYPKDNSSLVPAGPLVPGIVLPPPPNFFGPLEESKPVTSTTTTKKPTRLRMKTTTTPLPQLHPTTTAVPPTSMLDEKHTRKPPVHVLPVHQINNELKPVITTTPQPQVVTIVPVRHPPTNVRTSKPPKRPSVTILKPIRPANPPKIYVYDNEVAGKPFDVYGPPSRLKTVVSTTQVPLKIYYSTSSDIETNSIKHPPEKFHIGVARQKSTTKSPAQYYYYEETGSGGTTPKPQTENYFDIPKEYYVQAKRVNPATQTQRPQYIYVTSKPQRPHFRFVQQTPKTDTFSIHIARLQNQLHQYYTTPKPNYRQSPKPLYQFSFEATNYRQNNENNDEKFRPLPRYSVQIQPAIEIVPTEAPVQQPQQPQQQQQQQYYQQASTERPVPSRYYSTQRPDYEYEDVDLVQKQPNSVSTAKPISQYSFEATQSPVYQGYYTKPDEGYFDDNTRQYFTSFGKKIPSATTPIPQPPRKLNQYQQQQPVSLHKDINVNYFNPRPPQNPDAEYIVRNQQRINYPQVVKYSPPRPAVQYNQPNVNKVKNEAQDIIKTVPITTAEGQAGSFISYQLPGDDGAHFYFLTPQLAQRRDQGSGYYFSQENARVRRNRHRDQR